MNRFEKSSLFQRLATTWLGCTKSVRNSFNKYTILYNIGGILSPKIHKYFKQKLSEWNITGFLNECDIKEFRKR
ncbi:unnamed protein product [Rhizophagus irregularis]|uniref:Uncharacterized protein n=1 Tax=Rhizophagus irregularis TaxID=588596 RepID=A0A915ZWG9_9GLOM|nr:unnamed protein product [Rhizophagus irregularis]